MSVISPNLRRSKVFLRNFRRSSDRASVAARTAAARRRTVRERGECHLVRFYRCGFFEKRIEATYLGDADEATLFQFAAGDGQFLVQQMMVATSDDEARGHGNDGMF